MGCPIPCGCYVPCSANQLSEFPFFFSHNLNGDNRTMTLVEISENQSSMQCKGMQLRPPRQAFQPECLGQFWIKMSKIIQALTSKVLGMPSGFSF